jgi:hypothetical protein
MSQEKSHTRDSGGYELIKAIEGYLASGLSVERPPRPKAIVTTRMIPESKIYYTERWNSFTRFRSEISSKSKGIEEAPYKEIGDKINKLASSLVSIEQEVISCKEAIGKLYEELDERPLIKETRLFDIDEKLEVIQPIPIVIEEYKNEVIAGSPELEVYGVADNEPQAISNLKTGIRDLYYDLIESPKDELGKLPLSWLRILERSIRKHGNA